jgi:dihydrofolate synthase/folylpolyglutamate synthase
MIYFLEKGVDIVVLEVGMGGALDSTNAIDAPEVAVITNIGLEHTEYLGNTLEEIASTKAGIIKTGCHAVCYDGAPVVTEVIKNVCNEKNVPLRCVDFSRLTPVSESLDGQKFLWDGKKYDLALLGEHQLHNAATVLNVIEALKERGWKVTAKAIKEGLKTVKWPARLEILGRKPLFILDGGHNPQCAEALANSLDKLLGGKKAMFLLGVLADKDYPTMMTMMMPYAKEFVCITPDSGRALPAKDLAEWFRQRGAAAEAADDFVSGIKIAEKKAGKTGIIVCFGSLYLAGHIRVEYAKLHK